MFAVSAKRITAKFTSRAIDVILFVRLRRWNPQYSVQALPTTLQSVVQDRRKTANVLVPHRRKSERDTGHVSMLVVMMIAPTIRIAAKMKMMEISLASQREKMYMELIQGALADQHDQQLPKLIKIFQ